MMEKLTALGGDLARKARRQQVERVAGELRDLFGSAAIQIEDAVVQVRGKGIIKRWLIDPGLRFVGGGLK